MGALCDKMNPVTGSFCFLGNLQVLQLDAEYNFSSRTGANCTDGTVREDRRRKLDSAPETVAGGQLRWTAGR
jgi:hypothetical protein